MPSAGTRRSPRTWRRVSALCDGMLLARCTASRGTPGSAAPGAASVAVALPVRRLLRHEEDRIDVLAMYHGRRRPRVFEPYLVASRLKQDGPVWPTSRSMGHEMASNCGPFWRSGPPLSCFRILPSRDLTFPSLTSHLDCTSPALQASAPQPKATPRAPCLCAQSTHCASGELPPARRTQCTRAASERPPGAARSAREVHGTSRRTQDLTRSSATISWHFGIW